MKNKKRWIIVVSIILLISIGIGSYFLIFKKESKTEVPFTGFTFLDITELEYGSYSLQNFVEGIVCEEDCTYNGEKVDYEISEISKLTCN